MNKLYLLGSVGVASAVWSVACQSVYAETVRSYSKESSSERVRTEIPALSDIEHPAASVAEWLSQLSEADSSAVMQIVDVQLNATETGLTIVLNSSEGTLSPASTSVVGNALIADIPDATLALPDTDEFQSVNPTDEIAFVTVSNLPNNTVRVAITGVEAAPAAEVISGATGLVFNVSLEEGAIATEPAEEETIATEPAEEETIEIVVTGQQDRNSYIVPNASTGTRTDTPISEIPQSIQVIPRQVFEDQQAIRLEEIVENVSGVTFLGNDDGRNIEFAIRGVEGVPILRDGFRAFSSFGFQGRIEVANLEQVEVLRGPASILFGTIEPGGAINLISKKPLSEPLYNVQLQVGNRGFVRPSIDLSGPLTADGRLLYRLNALYQNRDSFRDYDNSFERFFIAPSLTWEISDRTDLNVSLEYIEDDDPADLGTVAFGDGIADIPPERITNNPDDTIESTFLNAGYTIEHRFSENWKLQNSFRYIFTDSEFSVVPLPLVLDETTGVLSRFFGASKDEQENFNVNTSVEGQFSTGSIEHRLLFGVDYAHTTSENQTPFDLFNPVPLNIFDPDPETFPEPALEDVPLTFGSDVRADRVGIYLQDQIDLLDNLFLLAGIRYETINQTRTNLSFGVITEDQESNDSFLPRIGIVYQPIEPISLYASYSRSFNPNENLDPDGDFLEPEEGEGFEVGVKAEVIPDVLSLSLAYFNITQKNVASADPIFPSVFTATGEQRNQGVEIDLAGELLPGWNIIASYAFIDGEVTEDSNPEIVGNELFGIPEHSANLWTTYEIQRGDLQGLEFGIGFSFVGERQGDIANSFEVDSFFLTRAAIAYQQNNWKAQLNFDNLFDVDFIEAASFGTSRVRGIFPGEPFTVRASFSVRF
ncbi:MAG: TonB-dependent receptor [Cyanobacteria bacterium P01_E01_bin.6]